jgi:tetratricopeptide (TPR) repeat protein
MDGNIVAELSSKGYWPALAMEYLKDKKHSKAVELCLLRLKDDPDIVSGRIILARALYHSGQVDAAEEEFYKILQKDPYNLVALKYLGDLKFKRGDEATAFSYYSRVLEIDPHTSRLSSSLEGQAPEETRILTLKKNSEEIETVSTQLRDIPFKTETVGDLLLAQGHPRLAREVYRELAARSANPRLLEKLDKIEEMLKPTKGKNV